MAAGVFADLTFDLKGRRSSRRTCCFRRGSVPVARLVDFLATLLATSAAAGSLRRSGAGRRVGSSLTDKPATAAGYRVRETAQVIVACLTLAGGAGDRADELCIVRGLRLTELRLAPAVAERQPVA